MSNKAKNPHATPDGVPKPGELIQWLEWREEQFTNELAEMSPEERKKAIEADKHIRDKMQS